MTMLTKKKESLAEIVILTTFGEIEKLEKALDNGLDAGWTVNEIAEALIQLYGYIGMPRSMNAIQALKRVTEERQAAGKEVVRGEEQMPVDKSIDRYENGRKIMNELAGFSVADLDWAKFCPSAPYIIYTAFAEVYLRDILDYATREFVTITTLAIQPGLIYQLQLHLNMGKNAGVTLDEIEALSEFVAERVGAGFAETLSVEARKIFA